ncbi:MAG: hypothetical protein ACREQ9_13720 [Candidatus Binatia bacterium]
MTVHGCTGTMDVADIVADDGRDLLGLIGKSLVFLGTNAFIGRHHGGEILVCLAPPRAELIAPAVPAIEGVQRLLWESAAMPLGLWPKPHRRRLADDGRVDHEGMVRFVQKPEDMLLIVCGGLGNLHALACHTFGPTRAVTRGF